jgi:hypothetical protein
VKATLKSGAVVEGTPEEVAQVLRALGEAPNVPVYVPYPVPQLAPVVPVFPGPWWGEITCTTDVAPCGGASTVYGEVKS